METTLVSWKSEQSWMMNPRTQDAHNERKKTIEKGKLQTIIYNLSENLF